MSAILRMQYMRYTVMDMVKALLLKRLPHLGVACYGDTTFEERVAEAINFARAACEDDFSGVAHVLVSVQDLSSDHFINKAVSSAEAIVKSVMVPMQESLTVRCEKADEKKNLLMFVITATKVVDRR